MFESLSDRLGGVFDKLRGRGALTELDVRAAMREVRIALLEADVALPVVKSFIDQVTADAIGADVEPQFNPKTAEVISREMSARLISLDPLAPDYLESMRYAGREIAQSMLRTAPG